MELFNQDRFYQDPTLLLWGDFHFSPRASSVGINNSALCSGRLSVHRQMEPSEKPEQVGIAPQIVKGSVVSVALPTRWLQPQQVSRKWEEGWPGSQKFQKLLEGV